MSAARLQPHDCPSECFADLCAHARTLRPWQGEARQQWTDASRDLLMAVADEAQRMAWGIELAMACAHTMPGVPLVLVAGLLLERE